MLSLLRRAEYGNRMSHRPSCCWLIPKVWCVRGACLPRTQQINYSTCSLHRASRHLNDDSQCCWQFKLVSWRWTLHLWKLVMASDTGSYRERQEMELEALQSIYADDVEDLRATVAWNVRISSTSIWKKEKETHGGNGIVERWCPKLECTPSVMMKLSSMCATFQTSNDPCEGAYRGAVILPNQDRSIII